jgi:hypothetical protein
MILLSDATPAALTARSTQLYASRTTATELHINTDRDGSAMRQVSRNGLRSPCYRSLQMPGC